MGPSTHVRHALRAARWPTREEAARARWLEALRLGASVMAEPRTRVPPMVRWRATARDGRPPVAPAWSPPPDG